MKKRSYLDHNATAPLRPEVREAMMAALGLFGNPSSVHGEGRAARSAVEAARAKVASLAGARPDQVIFTSGGSEANAMAVALASRTSRGAFYVTAVEHPSVLAAAIGSEAPAAVLPVDGHGLLDLNALEKVLSGPQIEGARPFLSVMAANNETGALQPVEQAAEMVREAGGLIHSDAVQAAGKIAIDFSRSGVDLMSLSAHKIGGPKGVGALIVRDGLAVAPIIRGGAQETRRRAGTENVPGIVGFGAAAECAAADLAAEDRIGALRTALEEGAVEAVPEAVVIAAGAKRLPNTVAIAVPGAKAETMVIGLDLAGVAVSAGSACSSGKVETSHVLSAMGVEPHIAEGAIRVSLGWDSEPQDVAKFLGAWSALAKRLQSQLAA